MRHDILLWVLIPLYLMIVGALVTKSMWLPQTEKATPVAVEDDAKAPKIDKTKEDATAKTSGAGLQVDESSGKRGLTPTCENELRRTGDLLRFFANRIQMGEEVESVVADMRQQEKKISAVCQD